MKNFRDYKDTIFPGILLLFSFGCSLYFAHLAHLKSLTALENVLFQIIISFTGLLGSFGIGQRNATETAKELIKPHARSAFRRLDSLYLSLSRVAAHIANYHIQTGTGSNNPETLIAVLDAIVIEQLTTADDALEDWNDIIPEEVKKIRERVNLKEASNDGSH